jgi:4-amino-4-deoxy-L-arabinose transferase-like glycosyltransferase
MNTNVEDFAEDAQIRRSLLWMIFVALVLRFITAFFSYKYLLDTSENYFSFGWETGRVARALASGQGFASPYNGNTGPTAALPPLYPLFVGEIFKLFGIYTKASALVILAIQSVISAITVIPIYYIATRAFGARVARYAGWTWAFFPYAIAISAGTIWSTSLSALMFALLLWFAFHLEEGAGWLAWIDLGMLAGLIGLNNPTILPLVAVLVIWVWVQLRREGKKCVPQALVAALIAALCIAPWVVRNYRVFNKFIPMRSNLGLHMYVGNTLDTSEYWHAELDPPHSPRELNEMMRMGEIAYMAHKKQQAFAFIKQHPGVYAYLCFKRVVDFWTGIWNLSPKYLKDNLGESLSIPLSTAVSIFAFIGLWRAFKRDRDTAWAFALCLIVYPLLYYMTTYEIPYRHPLDPLLVILAAAGVWGVPKESQSLPHNPS